MIHNNLKYVIGGKTYFIREIQENDLPERVSWMNNPSIYSSMHFDIPITLENTIRWYNKNQGNENRADMAIVDGEKVVAFCGITSIDH